MSGVIATAARLNPELRLAQAVSQFEASLSSDQKAAFRDQKSRSLRNPPDVNDVMQLTAQMNGSQQPEGRCFGPRFTKFLHGVQQFAALGDVVIGGSQNIVACGVWSLVRISLLVGELICRSQAGVLLPVRAINVVPTIGHRQLLLVP